MALCLVQSPAPSPGETRSLQRRPGSGYLGPAPEAAGRGRARLRRSIRPLSRARVFLAPGRKAWPRPEPAAAATFRPGGRAGAFHVPCVSQSPAGPRARGWAARGSGNGKGGKREVGKRSRGRAWLARTGSRGVGPAASSRLAAFGLPRPSRGAGGLPCRPAPPDSALPAASRAPPQLLSLSRPASQAARDGGPVFRSLPPLLLRELLSLSESSVPPTTGRPSFRFQFFFCVLLPLVFFALPRAPALSPLLFLAVNNSCLHLVGGHLPGP